MKPDWVPEDGNYYVMRGTWLVDRGADRIGVVREIGDVHVCGTVIIEWRYSSTEYVSTIGFREKLRSGRYAIDHNQHPYDKIDQYWGADLQDA